MDRGTTFEQRRDAVVAACAALTGIDTELWATSGAGLGDLMSVLDELAVRVDAARVEVLHEAADRGETGPGGPNHPRQRHPALRAAPHPRPHQGLPRTAGGRPRHLGPHPGAYDHWLAGRHSAAADQLAAPPPAGPAA